jgi:signal transduction histidine kinase
MNRLTVILLFLLTLPEAMMAQQYLVNHYTQNNGLPQNSINDLYWDPYGFLWLSTEEGLVRFDGNQFYSFNVGNTPYINSDRFRWILKDVDGKVYTSTAYGKVLQIDGASIHPSQYQTDGTKAMKGILPDSGCLNKIFEDGLASYKNEWVYPTHFVNCNQQNYVLGHHYIFQLENGISVDSILLPFKVQSFFNIGKNGYVFANRKLYHFDPKTKRLKLLNTQLPASANSKVYFHISKSKPTAFVNINKQIFEMIPGKNPLTFTYRFLVDVSKIVEGEINCIGRSEHSKYISIGSATNGLYLFKPKIFTTRYHTNTQVKYNGYYAQIPFNDSSVLDCYGDVIAAHSSYSSAFKMNGINKRTLYKTPSNILWTSKADTLLYQTSGTRPKMIPLRNTESINNIIPIGDSIMVITLRSVLFIYHNKVVKEILLLTDDTPRPNEDWTYGLIDGDSLLLALDNHIYSISLKPPHQIVKRFDYPSVRYMGKYKDWIIGTSYGHGMFVIKDNNLIKLPFDKYHHLQKAHSIEVVNNSEVFISTNNGLFETTIDEIAAFIEGKSDEIYYQYFSSDDGIENSEFNGAAYPSSVQLKNGVISFSNMNGLVWFKPKELPQHISPGYNPFYLNEIEVDGVLMPLKDTIFLTAQTEKTGIRYSVIYWFNKLNINLEYQLEGFTQKWSAMPPPGQTLTFTNLPAGTYALNIRCQNGFSSADIYYKTIYLVKEPHFYETVIFLALVLFTGILVVIGLVFVYNKRLINQNILLEQKVADRTQTLEETNQFLRASEQELRQSVVVKNKLISIISHDIVTPLKFISLVSKNFNTFDQKEQGNTKEVIKEIHHTSQRLYDNAQNILNWVRFQNNLIAVNKVNVSPFALVEDLCELFRDVASMQKSTIQNEVDMDDIIQTDKNILTILIQNILSNAVKYTHSCLIQITSSTKDGRYILSISDDGQGISENNLQRIESIQNKNKNISFDDSADGTGLGYLIIFELAELIHAKVDIQSSSKGTKVSITI